MRYAFSRRGALGLLGSAALTSLASVPAWAADSEDARFAAIAQRWLDGSLRLSPVSATQVGEHRYDHELDDAGPAGRKAGEDFDRAILKDLAGIDRAKLSRANQVDALILENRVRASLWDSETLQSWAWDPLVYNELAGGALYTLMARAFAPLPIRLAAATARMEKLPGLFAQMRANLVPGRVPEIHAKTLAKQNMGVMSLADGLIAPHAGVLPADGQKRLVAALAALRIAVTEHQKWIDTTLVPNAKGDFRLGAKLYDEKLAFALNSPLSRKAIRERADAAVKETRAEMYGIARNYLAGRSGTLEAPDAPSLAQEQAVIEAALADAYADVPARDRVVEFAKETLKQATDFVRAKDLVTVPDTPVKIITMPEFQQGVAVAYCDPPGALEKGQDTFYAISPIPKDWTDAQTQSFLREYNDFGIHEVTIHEAMPGHYLQLAHSNAYPSVLRSVLYSGPFVEGWACYAEDFVADEGYLDRNPLYLLVHLKLRLRTIVNAILDQAVHVDGISEKDAMQMMTVTAFQQEREAAGKWVRACVSSAQLPTYFVGLDEHWDCRREAETRWGAAFSLKRYHDAILSYGSPPVRYARALLFDETIA